MIGNKIKNLRRAAGISQTELGRGLDVRQSTVAMWETGKNSPSYDMLTRLAEFFCIDMGDLLGKGSGVIKIPVLGRVQAGIPVTATEDIVGYEEISEESIRSGEYFALQIRGDSMEPRMYEGDIVIVRRQEVVENGEIAIVLVDGEDATCKKFYVHNEGISLVSLNPSYAPIFFTKEELKTRRVEVLGKVSELRSRF